MFNLDKNIYKRCIFNNAKLYLLLQAIKTKSRNLFNTSIRKIVN